MSAPRREGPFPELSLPELGGGARSLGSLSASGNALILLGHRGCKTTRQTLPFVDRIHRRRGAGHAAVAVLQDDAPTAAELRRSLGLELPVLLEDDPYPLASSLGVVSVPTLFLVRPGNRIARAVEGFSRAELESLAEELAVAGPLFTPEDKAPAFRPG